MVFPPSEGQITFDGRPIRIVVNPCEFGLLHPHFSRLPRFLRSLTVYENLRIAVEVAQGVNSQSLDGSRLVNASTIRWMS